MPVFDSHLHIIDPAYPLVENNGYLPDAFTVDAYLSRIKGLGISSGAVVSGSFQAFDQDYLVAALERLGNQFVGVTQLPESVSDKEIRRLNEAGVRALRFNIKRGGSEKVEHLETFARRIYDLVGWHVELYAGFDALRDLKALLPTLPAVSVDHLGLNAESLPILRELVAGGVKVKATGFGRVDFDAMSAIEMLYRENPAALMFGTDLPSTRAPKPFQDSDLLGLENVLSSEAKERILWKNGREFYRLDNTSH